MAISEKAMQYCEKMFPDHGSELLKTDPEFIELFANFAFDEVVNHDDLMIRRALWRYWRHCWAVRVSTGFGLCSPPL